MYNIKKIKIIIMVDYITNEDTIIFSPEFNLPLNPLILINYKKIIFSNYELTESLFDAYSNSNFSNKKMFSSSFNHPLLNSLDGLINLTHIKFGYSFNHPLSNSLNGLINLTHINFGFNFNQSLSNSLDKLINLTHINFGYRFNCPLLNSLNELINLVHINFGYYFNHPLSNSLDKLINLTHINLGYEFNEKLDIPHNIKSIILDCNNQYIINNLSDNIEELELGLNFDLELNDLPSSIKKIIFHKKSEYNIPLNNLPKGIELLELPKYYNIPIINIPQELKKIICSKDYEFINDFTNFKVETY
jgi:hypothetical protein